MKVHWMKSVLKSVNAELSAQRIEHLIYTMCTTSGYKRIFRVCVIVIVKRYFGFVCVSTDKHPVL